MRGDARLSRGQEWRYYACPVSEGRGGRLDEDGNLVACHAKRVRADAAEGFVVDALSEFLLPADEIAAARDELRERLRAPKPGVADEQRARLRSRLEKLRDLYSWGDLTEADYGKQKAEAEALMVALPDNDKLVMFDRHRAIAASLPDAIAAATPDKVQELVALLVERVETSNQRVSRVTWVPAARPFFRDEGAERDEEAALLWRPRRESNSRRRP